MKHVAFFVFIFYFINITSSKDKTQEPATNFTIFY